MHSRPCSSWGYLFGRSYPATWCFPGNGILLFRVITSFCFRCSLRGLPFSAAIIPSPPNAKPGNWGRKGLSDLWGPKSQGLDWLFPNVRNWKPRKRESSNMIFRDLWDSKSQCSQCITVHASTDSWTSYDGKKWKGQVEVPERLDLMTWHKCFTSKSMMQSTEIDGRGFARPTAEIDLLVSLSEPLRCGLTKWAQ